MPEITVELGESFPMVVRFGEHETAMDAPVRAGGTGLPTPSDYFVASIAACKVFYAFTFAQRHGLETRGIRARVEAKHGDKCIESVKVVITMPSDVPEELRDGLRRMVGACYVAASIRLPTDVEFSIE